MRRDVLPLLVLFGGLYFVQGVVEPTACLPSQPLQSWMEGQGQGPEAIGRFFGTIGIAWSLKPLFGLLTDFVPLFGTHRRSYLALSTLATAVGFGLLGWAWGPGAMGWGQWLFVALGVAIATSDVAVDALAVEHGQPLGITGRIQSVQWGASSTASVLAGVGGGFLASGGRLGWTFGICALLALGSFLLVLGVVREPRRGERTADELRLAWAELRAGNRAVILGAVAAFLFLWTFNPFSTNVLQQYTTGVLGLSEQAYGNLVSVQALAQVAACVAYAWGCERVRFGTLIHVCIASGILSTIVYWPMSGLGSAVVANVLFGFAYQVSMLVTMDLAARTCPRAAAATAFAVLMAVSNTGGTLAIGLGGGWYEALAASLGPDRAFDVLVGIGAASTAACWLLVPVLKRAGVPWR